MPRDLELEAADLLRARRGGDAVRARAVRDASTPAAAVDARARRARHVPARARSCSARGTRGAGVLAMAITALDRDGAADVPPPLLQPDLGLLHAAVLARARHGGRCGTAIARAARAARALHAASARSPTRSLLPIPAARRSRSSSRSTCASASARRAVGLPSAGRLWRGGRALALDGAAGAAARACRSPRRSGRCWDAAQRAASTRTRRSSRGAATSSTSSPRYQFFALPTDTLWWLAVAAMVGARRMAPLAAAARRSAWGLGVARSSRSSRAAIWFRQRDYGWYFEFKTLAFAAPLARGLRRRGAVALSAALGGARPGRCSSRRRWSRRAPRSATNGAQLSRGQLELREWARRLPRDASIRLDTWPPDQLWGAYMLATASRSAASSRCSAPTTRTCRSRARPTTSCVDLEGRRFYQRAYDGRREGRGRRAAALERPLLAVQDENATCPGPSSVRGARSTNEPLAGRRLDRRAQLGLGPLGRELLEPRPPALRRARRAAPRRVTASASSSATIAEVGLARRSRAPRRRPPRASRPSGRATTGIPKWNASSSGMQKPSCSDR